MVEADQVLRCRHLGNSTLPQKDSPRDKDHKSDFAIFMVHTKASAEQPSN